MSDARHAPPRNNPPRDVSSESTFALHGRRNADWCVGSIDDCVLLYWRLKSTLEGAECTRNAFAELCRRPGLKKIALLTIIDQKCDVRASAPVRDAVAAILKTHENRISAGAIAFEGQGFRMTLVRSVITAINLASKSRFPSGVFANVPDAVEWTLKQMSAAGSNVDKQSLLTAVDRVRAELVTAELSHRPTPA